jgi:hypothetical protein
MTVLDNILDSARRAFARARKMNDLNDRDETAFQLGYATAVDDLRKEMAAQIRAIEASASRPMQPIDVVRVDWSVPCSNCGMDSCEGCGA